MIRKKHIEGERRRGRKRGERGGRAFSNYRRAFRVEETLFVKLRVVLREENKKEMGKSSLTAEVFEEMGGGVETLCTTSLV